MKVTERRPSSSMLLVKDKAKREAKGLVRILFGKRKRPREASSVPNRGRFEKEKKKEDHQPLHEPEEKSAFSTLGSNEKGGRKRSSS